MELPTNLGVVFTVNDELSTESWLLEDSNPELPALMNDTFSSLSRWIRKVFIDLKFANSVIGHYILTTLCQKQKSTILNKKI